MIKPSREIKLFGGLTIARNTKANDIDMVEEKDEEEDNKLRRQKSIKKQSHPVMNDMVNCHGITKYYIPPLAKVKLGSKVVFRVSIVMVTVFIGIPGLAKAAMKPSGVNVMHLNDVFSQ